MQQLMKFLGMTGILMKELLSFLLQQNKWVHCGSDYRTRFPALLKITVCRYIDIGS
ncbi:hypothetical protein M758_1G020300 [Ceratodon purpureus]|uniref:Uncharacterized protein n=1 Tax=Ceratodon purpureus TaxID=3225 RepID=A0A8T0J0G4_CERPU|nr:hypothetical protein KC19_1G021500 [Ceratodon purpureus]KAG0628352.1 hypothetical protein M758_1G020300 [Ceratodon purpureus]